MRNLLALLLISCSLLSTVAVADPVPVIIQPGEHRYHVIGEYLIDYSKSITLNDLLNHPNAYDFIQHDLTALNFGFQPHPVWVRISIDNPLQKAKYVLIMIDYPLLNHVEFYSPLQNNEYEKTITGINYPFKSRSVNNKYFTFPVTIPANATQTFYFKVVSSYNFSIPLTVNTPLGLLNFLSWEHLWLGAYFGLIIAMILYNTFLFFTIRDNVYLYYVGLIFFSGSVQIGMSGIVFQYMQEATYWYTKHFYFSGAMSILFLIQFCRHFLQTRINIPKFDNVLIGILVIDIFLLILLFTYEVYSYLPIVLLALTSVICQVYSGISAYIKGYSPARYYLLASSMYAIGGFIICLYGLAIIDATVIVKSSFLLGSSLEAILLSFALADRINHLKQEKTASLLAAKKAEAQAKTKSDFLAKMSHELRTPMTGLIGITDLLTQSELSPKQRYYLEIAKHSGEELLKLINNILDHAKLEANKIDLDITEIHIESYIDDIVNEYGIFMRQKPIEITATIDPNLPKQIKADPLRLKQIIKHLLDNAIKFTEKGSISLQAQTVEDHQKKYIQFIIKDTGLGFDTKHSNILFESFEQAEMGDARRFEGAGLGLTIAKQLAELMQGEISLSSTPGHGSTFWFNIPIDETSITLPEKPATLKTTLPIILISDNRDLYQICQEQFMYLNLKYTRIIPSDFIHKTWASQTQTVFIIEDTNDQDTKFIIEKITDHYNKHDDYFILVIPTGELHSTFTEKQLNLNYIEKPFTSYKIKNALLEVFSSERFVETESSHTAALLENKHFLIVEDNPVNQMYVQTILKNFKCTFDIANNGQDALDKISKSASPYHYILMDCEMPVMNGFDATKQIRASDSSTPIIGLTAHDEADIRKKCINYGMTAVLTKPIDAKKLLATLIHSGRLHASSQNQK